MIINHNINAMIAYRNMTTNTFMMGRAMERLSSGLRINRAGDDPAGLAISEKMRAQIRGLEMASRNAQDGISAIQVAEGALNETHSILQRMRELSVQAANGTYSEEDRKHIQNEINQLTSAINDIGENTEFNTIKLLKDNWDMKIQTGANTGQYSGISLKDMRANALGIIGDDEARGLDVSNQENASEAIKKYDDAIKKVSSFRGTLGATQNVLEHRINYLNNTAENLIAAESRIRDADMAKEMMNFTKYSILQQVAQAMFAQVSRQPERLIELLKSL